MYILVLLLPLLSSIVVGFGGWFLGIYGACFFSTASLFVAFIIACFIFYEILYCGVEVYIELFDWFSIGAMKLSFNFLFDSITAVMLIVVTGISFLVHLYSTSYMEKDPHLIRFMAYLSLFTFFMLSLVTSGNLIQMFLGWEGVGLSSYLLINFWFTRIEANKSALKAIIVNRFGDIGIILALGGIFILFRSFDYGVIFSLIDDLDHAYFSIFKWSYHGLSVCSFFLFLGCVGKSAQLGLHTWLPDAMEGPTPVSALIHAATMVTAGVFLLIRMSHIIDYSPSILLTVVLVGAFTAFFAGTIGIFQNDLKRVIAYSTCSQLGYMVFACGLSNYSVAMFHLMNHAFFKALLFLSAGAVIHAVMDEQDMRKLGGLVKLLPLTYSGFVIGSLALMGFPYSTGFYSKDLILELSYSNYYFDGIISYILGVLGAIFTAFYSIRLLYITFLSEANFSRAILPFVHDAPLKMFVPLIILALLSIFGGYIFKDLFVGLGTELWRSSISTITEENYILEAEFLPSYIKLLPVFFSIYGAGVAFLLYWITPQLTYFVSFSKVHALMRQVYCFFNGKWFFDVIYNYYLIRFFFNFCYEFTFKILDRGFFEILGPTGLVRFFSNCSLSVSKMQSGYIFNYIFLMCFSIVWGVAYITFNNFNLILVDDCFLFFFMVIIVLFFNVRKAVNESYKEVKIVKSKLRMQLIHLRDMIENYVVENFIFGLTRKDIQKFYKFVKDWW